MDLFTIGNGILTVAGVGLAIWAKIDAGSAKKAVKKAVGKNNDQIARDNARDLLQKLNEASKAAMGRRQGASRAASVGRSLAQDLQAIQLAQDALATAVVGSDQVLTIRLRNAAADLENALNVINANDARDGWADAQGAVQRVIPQVESKFLELGAKGLF